MIWYIWSAGRLHQRSPSRSPSHSPSPSLSPSSRSVPRSLARSPTHLLTYPVTPDTSSHTHAHTPVVQAVAAVLRVHPGVLRQAGQLAQDQDHLAGRDAGAATSTSVLAIAYAFLGTGVTPRALLGAHNLSDADWCLQSGGMPDSRLQVPSPASSPLKNVLL